jgi:tetratricopeptide (TPR) repeat protein
VSGRLSAAVDFCNANRPDLAERLAREELAEDPESWDAHRLLAVCLRARGDLKASLAEAEAALAIAPNSWHCLLERARTLGRLRRYAEAELDVHGALALEPAEASLHAELAEILTDRGKLADAAMAAREGMRLDPHHVPSVNALALALFHADRFADARQVIGEALVDEPGLALLHNNLGAAFLATGELTLAEAELREALRLDPTDELAQSNLRLTERVGVIQGHIPLPDRLRSPVALWLGAPALARRLVILAGVLFFFAVAGVLVVRGLVFGSMAAITLVVGLIIAGIGDIRSSRRKTDRHDGPDGE